MGESITHTIGFFALHSILPPTLLHLPFYAESHVLVALEVEEVTVRYCNELEAPLKLECFPLTYRSPAMQQLSVFFTSTLKANPSVGCTARAFVAFSKDELY